MRHFPRSDVRILEGALPVSVSERVKFLRPSGLLSAAVVEGLLEHHFHFSFFC